LTLSCAQERFTKHAAAAKKMRPLRVPCEKLCCENIFSSLAGDEAAVAALMRTAQHEDATPILVLETMSCLWAIMFVNKVLLASACPK